MSNLNQAISQWRRQMAAGGIRDPKILDELESHLRDDVDSQVRSGSSVEQAFQTATRRMGQAALLRREFEKEAKAKRVRLRKQLLCLFGLSVGLVFAIAIFCCYMLLPLAVRAQGQYASWLGVQNDQASFGFACRLVVGMCLGLALPVGSLMLVRLRILNGQKLARLRPYMIVVNLILGAVLTTPEVVTQLILFVPLQALCEVSILIARIWDRRAPNCA